MKKREIAEIKKQFKVTECSITRLRGCYVNPNGEPEAWINKPFMSLPEEEMFKYLRMGTDCLRGKLGDKLHNLAAEPENLEFGEKLEWLRKTRLKDDEVFEDFCAKVMESNREWVGGHIILAMHSVYDIPGVTDDGIEMEDASESVYEYVMVCICPVARPIPYIGYNEDKHVFERTVPPLAILGPKLGILYPAFNDRRADPHGALVFQDNPNTGNTTIKGLFNCSIGRTDKQKKEALENVMQRILSGQSEFWQLKDIYERIINRLLEWNKEDDLMLTKKDIRAILEEAGAALETLEEFDDIWDEFFGEEETLPAKKIVDEKKLKVETDGAVINVKPSGLRKVTVEHANGEKYLTIQITGRTEVNGVPVKETDKQ